jgi:histidinol dehydrogenase
MKIVINPPKETWKELLKRPYEDNRMVLDSVQSILNAVKQHGDEALRSFTKKFDGVELEGFEVNENEVRAAEAEITPALKKALHQAKSNIEKFHLAQQYAEAAVDTMPGIRCWRKSVGIEKVGLYVPGGTAPLFSTVLMLGIPAKIAGCKEVILCTPSDKNGSVHPAILYSAQLVGVTRIFKIGGAQAIAAMAFGTQTVPAVFKIFGPGNQYVTAAKQLVQMQGVPIDMPAGPSEVCILADGSTSPAYVAADLLSQAEHGHDSQVLLVCTEEHTVESVKIELQHQLKKLPRKDIADKVMANSKAVVMKDMDAAIELVNQYAGEHLIVSCNNADTVAEKIINAGSVFIGQFSPESVGDYASGTNHTLPTNGFAKAYSGVSVDSFVKKISFQKLSREGLKNISDTVIEMAEAEGLQAHAEAVKVRL